MQRPVKPAKPAALTVVHAADLHLDSPFRGIGSAMESSPRWRQVMRAATFDAFDALIQLCISEKADLLLLAGDVYDAADRSLKAQLKLRDGLARLEKEAGTSTFVVHGNHDPVAERAAPIAWPASVSFFGAENVETVRAEKDGAPPVTVTGISYGKREETRNLARQFRAPDDKAFHIALLHCNAGGDTGHAPYAPCTLRDLQGAGFDVWALGHVHSRQVLCEKPLILYPGALQGRNRHEDGPRGCAVITVDESGAVQHTFRALDAVRWRTIDVDISRLETLEAVLDATLSEIRRHLQQDEPRPHVIDILLTGSGTLGSTCQRKDNLADLRDLLRETLAADAEPSAWIRDIRAACDHPIDLQAQRRREDLVGQVLQAAQTYRDSQGAMKELDAVLAPLYRHARARRALNTVTSDEWSQLLSDAERLCIDLLDGKD